MSAPSGSTDSDGFTVPPPPAKRQLRPTSSVPTTTEFYGEKHGISADLQAALQSVGRRGRQNVAMGHATHRAFERTQSVPSHVLSSSALPNAGFTTALDAMSHAHGIISKEALRSGELQPFYSGGSDENKNVDGLSLSPRGRNRRLKFNENGEVEEEVDEPLFPSSRSALETREVTHLTAARKRRSSPAEPTSDTETEIGDEDEDTPSFAPVSTFTSNASDFPSVFKSPAMTQPELFGPTGSTSKAFPSAFKGVNARELRGLPGARKLGFGKAMSAPVGSLGGWGMDVDMSSGGDQQVDGGDEDGFDIKEWAENEQF
ncbi:hypothetical protein I204_07517 [Kwoniella mangroviensis CBS 8886]|uniref:hypothetical protein n=1 Tax=Kwoniella mangroviensis CBS 8507 TaxID=1296122 RepID=UPI00080D2815|nr:uncharacterized protein I203_08503 [Kwoniella mangroviensis CBS 8507]OCF62414.1 hypothetical protein I203_08503 [Kwoniella mangroviensis CBS 8507]OCF71459.1 hypothetical protein I204_07517 [Kwoniella mangroviensis CBS 8886]